MTSKYKRLVKNLVLIFLGSFGSKLITFVMLPFYTSWLSVEDYGIVDLINVYATLLLGLVTASISEAAFVFSKNETKENQKIYFSSGLFISLVFLTISGIIFLCIDNYFSKDTQNTFINNIWFVYAFIISKYFMAFVQQFIKGINKMKVYSSIGIVLSLSTAIFAFIFVKSYGVYGYVLANILAYLVGIIYAVFAAKVFEYFSIQSIRYTNFLEMLKYSIPLIPNAIMWWFIGYFNRPLLEQYVGLEKIGLLAVANKFPTLLVTLFSIFFHSWQVSVLEEFGKKDYKYFYNTIFRALILLISSGVIVLSLFSKYIIKYLIDEAFYMSWIYIPLLAVAPLFQAISSFSAVNFNAVKKTKYIFYASLIGAFASIICNYLLIPIYGVWGAIYSIIISYIIMAFMRVFYAWRFVKITNLIQNGITIICPLLISLILVNEVNESLKVPLIVLLIVFFTIINKDYFKYLKKIKKFKI